MTGLAVGLPLLATLLLGKDGPDPARLSPDQFSLLADRLEHASSFKVRIQAALILGQGGGPEAEPLLREVLRDDGTAAVRAAAALALVDLDGLRALAPLVEALGDDDAFVRGEAEKALNVLAEREGAALALPLASAIAAGPEAAKPVGLRVLAGLDGAGADGLVTLLADPAASVRDGARQALETLPGPVANAALERALRSGSFGVRVVAAELAGERRDADALPALADAAADPTEVPEVQDAARQAIANLRNAIQPSRESAALRATEGEPQRRIRALVLLAAKGGPDAEPACAVALHDPSPLVRAYAVQSLGALGDRRALAPLRELLGREDWAPLDAVLEGAIHRLERAAPAPAVAAP